LNMHREQLKTETDRVSERTEFLRWSKIRVLQHNMWEFGDDYSIRIFFACAVSISFEDHRDFIMVSHVLHTTVMRKLLRFPIKSFCCATGS
jgi:hypothetical protein